MNERIAKLIDQSGFGSYAEIPDTYILHKNDLVEFAELIVRECAEVSSQAEKQCQHPGTMMKKHFGVEE